jgi:hypothetical protein
MHAFTRNLCIGMLMLASTAQAENALWVGSFVNEKQSNDGIEAAIETAVASMNFVKRPIARSRLRKTNTPYERITISRTADRVSVAFDDQPPIDMPVDGRAVKWTRSDGEVFDVSAQVRADALVQTFKAEDGQRMNTFTANEAGQMTMEAQITSSQLSTPVIYTLLYERGVNSSR